MRISNRQMTWLMGSLAISVGALINYVGDRLLDVRLELFWGVETFSPLWLVDLFIVPFVAGFAVAAIYGLGGKLLCYIAPLIPRCISYWQMHQVELPEGVTVLPLAFWVLVLILAVEAAAFGGVAGEILVKRTYGRRPRGMVYKQRADANSDSAEG